MDNEPQYQGHHKMWCYQNITRLLEEDLNIYIIPATAHEVRQEEKETNRK